MLEPQKFTQFLLQLIIQRVESGRKVMGLCECTTPLLTTHNLQRSEL